MNRDYILGAERLLFHISREMVAYVQRIPEGPIREMVRLVCDQVLKLISKAITKLDDEVNADMDADTERKMNELRSVTNR